MIPTQMINLGREKGGEVGGNQRLARKTPIPDPSLPRATIHMTLAARWPAPRFVARPRGVPQHALRPPTPAAKAFSGGSMTRLMQKWAEPGAELSRGVPTCACDK